MNNKKILIFLVFLLFITIPISFAGDNNTLIEASGDIETLEVGDVDNVSLSNDNDVLNAGDVYFDASASSDGDGTQSKPYKTLNSGRLSGSTNYHFAPGQYSISSAPYSSMFGQSEMNIIGTNPEKTIIQYTGSGNFLSGGTYSFTGITLKNINIVSNSISATNTIFDSAKAVVEPETSGSYNYGNSYGGAIKISSSGSGSSFYDDLWNLFNQSGSSSSDIKFDNCVFRNNNAAYGGAFYIDGATVTITNSKFESNHAPNGGGAIAAVNKAKLTLTNCEFNGDYSSYDGGVVYLFNGTEATIKNTNFNNCQAGIGAAIASINSKTTVTGCNFNKNKVLYAGGAIYAMYGSLTVESSNFDSNEAVIGGAIYADNLTAFKVSGGKYSNNVASNVGGAIVSCANAKTIISNPTYSNNYALKDNNLHESEFLDVFVGSENYTMLQYKSQYTGSLPSKFDLRTYGYVSPLEDQNASGNCWAYATIAALESCILKASGKTFDLSEGNLKNLVQKYSNYGWTYETNQGGFYEMVMGYLTGWLGPVNASMDPADDWDVLAPVLNSVVHVQNIQFLQRSSYTDNNAIKEAIMKYGGVATEIYMDFSSTYYNSNTYGYYVNDDKERNHALCVIGWDDTFSRNKFTHTAPGDGAWIVKNSYGSRWGNGGYGYVSYYDHVLFSLKKNQLNAYTFIFNDTIRFNKNYQYDFGYTDYFIDGSDTIWCKNEFVSAGNDNLAAFSTFFNSSCDWEAYVYVNGELKHTQSGKGVYGYYTFNFDNQVPLKTGDKFAIALKIHRDKSQGYASFAIAEKTTYGLSHEHAGAGVSFYSKDGKTWTDLYKFEFNASDYGHMYYSQVACLKAFTTEGDKEILNTTISIISANTTGVVVSVKDQYGNNVGMGSVKFTINSKDYTSSVSAGKAILNTYLKPGNYTIKAEYIANSNYDASSTSKTVSLKKEDLALTINNGNITYGQDLTLNITLTNAIGEAVSLPISIEVNGKKYSNGEKITNPTPGNYTIIAGVRETNQYNTQITSKVINVAKASSTLKLEIADINVGDKLNVKAVLSNVDSAVVSVKVNNKNYNISIKNGNGNLVINETLHYGDYTADAVFSGNEVYLPTSDSTSFKVNKLNPTITSFSKDIVEGETAIVNVTLPSDIKDNLTLSINGATYIRSSTNGKIIFEVVNLNAGINDYSITFNGDDKYNQRTIKGSVNVLSKAKENLTLTPSSRDITEGQTLTVRVDLPADINSNLSLTINGKSYTTKASNGVAVFAVDGMKVGGYEYTVKFDGDDKYNSASCKGFVNVLSKAKENLTLTPSSGDITEGQTLTVSVDLPSDITAVLSLAINGKSYTTKASNGVAVFVVDGVKAGSYEYTVKFDGDDKYNSASCKGSVNVLSKSKENIKLTVNADDICEGEKLTVNVELSADISSALTLSIDGKTYSAKSQNGKANFIIPDLKAGSYDFTVSFSGDDKYNPISEKSTVNVFAKSKENTTLYISCDDIVEGETLTVDVVLPADITSELSLTINGKTYSASSTNGIATFKVSDLKAGSYDFTVSFSGDDKHNQASEKSNVKVSKAKENITLLISCDDIDEGENAIVTVILPADISSNLSLIIAGQTYSAQSSNGVATFNIANLKAGSYDFTVRFSGDDKYNPASEKSGINVNKVKQNITLSLSNIGSEINVVLSKDISADLSLTINNKTYSLKAQNGKAKFNAGNLKAGTYDYSVTFDGDENYNPAGSKSSLTIKEAEKTKTTPEIISTDNVKANADNVNVKLPENATGSVIVYVDGKQHSSSQLVNGTADISLTDLAAGAHLIEVKYSGDDQYSEVTSHSAILINETIKTPVKIGTIIDVESAFTRLANDYFAGERGDYFYAILKDINGNVLANKMVQIAVNGPIYNVTTDKDGRAGLQVNLANANVYTYALSFKGDGEYSSAPMASSKLTVTKKSTSITAASKTFKVKSKKTVSVTLNTIKNPYDGKTYLKTGKKLTLKVNGKTYSAKINKKGVAKFTVQLTKKGKFTAKITFAGDKTYSGCKKSIKLTVK